MKEFSKQINDETTTIVIRSLKGADGFYAWYNHHSSICVTVSEHDDRYNVVCNAVDNQKVLGYPY